MNILKSFITYCSLSRIENSFIASLLLLILAITSNKDDQMTYLFMSILLSQRREYLWNAKNLNSVSDVSNPYRSFNLSCYAGSNLKKIIYEGDSIKIDTFTCNQSLSEFVDDSKTKDREVFNLERKIKKRFEEYWNMYLLLEPEYKYQSVNYIIKKFNLRIYKKYQQSESKYKYKMKIIDKPRLILKDIIPL
jgi:hypothetical protein